MMPFTVRITPAQNGFVVSRESLDGTVEMRMGLPSWWVFETLLSLKTWLTEWAADNVKEKPDAKP